MTARLPLEKLDKGRIGIGLGSLCLAFLAASIALGLNFYPTIEIEKGRRDTSLNEFNQPIRVYVYGWPWTAWVCFERVPIESFAFRGKWGSDYFIQVKPLPEPTYVLNDGYWDYHGLLGNAVVLLAASLSVLCLAEWILGRRRAVSTGRRRE